MQYCTKCKISISSKTDRCPLCHKILPDISNQDTTQSYPDFEIIIKKHSKLVKAISFTSIFLIILSVAINLVTWNGNLWCVIFSACVLYAWLLGLFTFNKRAHLGQKLMIHAIVIPLLLIIINTFAYSTYTMNQVTWAVSYAMPITFICFILVANCIMIKRHQNRHDFLLYQLFLCVIGFVPLTLVLSGVARPILPSIIAAGCSYFTIIGLVVFAKRIIKLEFRRKFHT